MDYEIYDRETKRKLNSSFEKPYSPKFIMRILINFLALIVADYLLDSLTISSIGYVAIAGLILTIFNATLKPLLIILTLPFTVITLGLFYPIINVIILNILDFVMSNKFELNGFFTAIAVSIIIAIINFAITNVVTTKKY